MKKRFLSILLTSALSISYVQHQEVDILVVENKTELVFKAINHTDVRQEITLKISISNLSGYEKPITKLVSAKDTVHFIDLFFVEGTRWEYKTDFTFHPKPSDVEITNQQKKLKEQLLEGIDHSDKDIIIFVKQGCSRSSQVLSDLKRKKVPFKSFGIENNSYEKIMWELLWIEDPKLSEVTFPVVLADDKIYVNITNLKQFAKDLVVMPNP